MTIYTKQFFWYNNKKVILKKNKLEINQQIVVFIPIFFFENEIIKNKKEIIEIIKKRVGKPINAGIDILFSEYSTIFVYCILNLFASNKFS